MQPDITITPTGTHIFTGPDAMAYLRARTLVSALRLYAKTGIIPTRGVTATAMLRMASEITAKTYKRGQHAQAAADVAAWADTLRGALDIEVRK